MEKYNLHYSPPPPPPQTLKMGQGHWNWHAGTQPDGCDDCCTLKTPSLIFKTDATWSPILSLRLSLFPSQSATVHLYLCQNHFLQMYVYFVNAGSVELLICWWVPSCRLQRKGKRKKGKGKKQRGRKQYLILLSFLTEWLLSLFQLSLQQRYPLL